jgi:hypothetical protein
LSIDDPGSAGMPIPDTRECAAAGRCNDRPALGAPS